MNTTPMSPAVMQAIARYFQALSEPTRLILLNELRKGPQNVGDLAQMSGFTAANISRHLSLLAQQGMVIREAQGNSAYYRIADEAVYDLCDLVCGHLAKRFQKQQDEHAGLFSGSAS